MILLSMYLKMQIMYQNSKGEIAHLGHYWILT